MIDKRKNDIFGIIENIMPVSKEEKTSKDVKKDVLEEMAEAGLHLGHKTSKVHPNMKPYIYGMRNYIHIIDLEKTKEKLDEGLGFIKKTIADGEKVLFVGTKVQLKNILKEAAKDCGSPYIAERWLGGTFTNFSTIKKRIDYFKELKERKKKGELEKYTKKERADFDKELKELETKFGGLVDLEGLPKAILVADTANNLSAVKEARKKGVKVVAITDTNTDPTLVDYPIPANDDAISSVKYILEQVKEAVLKSKPKK